jgi:hypothetical protein
MIEPAHPKRCVLVAVDMEQYSKRDNLQQYLAQQVFHEVMAEAVDAAGLRRRDWIIQQAGDGELSILPPDISEPAVVAELAPALDRILRLRNGGRLPEAKVRLRVAIHQGLVHLDGANGVPGAAAVEVCRLCDADVLRQALKHFTGASVALIVSQSIYDEVVKHGYRGLRTDRFAPVEVTVKELRTKAWIYVPEEDANTLSPTPFQPAAEPARKPAAEPPSGWAFQNVTTHGPTVFGPDGTAIGTVNGTVNGTFNGRAS